MTSVLGKSNMSHFVLLRCVKILVLKILMILCFLLSLILAPLFLLFLLPIYLYRLCLWLCVKCCCCCCPSFRNFGEILDSHSVLFGVDSIYKDPFCVCVARFVCEGQVTDLEKLCKIIEENWIKCKLSNGQLKYPQLQQYVEQYGGFLWWKKEQNFNIGNHVKFLDRKNPGAFTTPKEVHETWNEMSMNAFDDFRSPWEILIIPYYREPMKKAPLAKFPSVDSTISNASTNTASSTTPPPAPPPAEPEKSVIIFRWHHVLADGYSILSLLSNGTALNLNLKTVAKAKLHSSPPTFCRKVGNGLLMFFTGPFVLLSTLFKSSDTNPWHLTEKKLTRYWHLGCTEKIPIETVFSIKASCGVSFTSVLLATVSGAMRKLMIRDVQLDPSKSMPKYITCGIPLPLAGRPPGLTNHWAMCTISLPVHEENPFKRLQMIENDLKEIKSTCQPNISHFVTPFLGCLPSNWVKVIAKNRLTTVVCSIMPGPPETIKNFQGDKILDAMYINGCGPGRNGFTFSVLSFAGTLQFATTVDSAFSPNESITSDLTVAMEEELRFLKQAAVPKPIGV